MELVLDRGRALPQPVGRRAALVFPLEATVVELELGRERTRIDRSRFALVPARTRSTGRHAGALIGRRSA
jgi:hypothetical protein